MGPLAQLAIAAAPSLINGISQAITNKQQKRFAEQQYATQRADNLKDWEKQNEYNSPIAQMTRLSEAGLNPNLIYKGGATNQAGDISKAQFGSYNPQAPKFEMDVADTLSKFQNYQNQQLQADNLKQNLQIAKAQEQYIQANTLNKLKDTDYKSFQLYRGNTLLDYQADAAKEGLYLTRAKTAYTYGQNERAWIMSSPKVNETLARIAQIKSNASKVPFEKEVLRQRAEQLRNDNQITPKLKWQQKETNKILQESALIKNLMMGGQRSLIEIQKNAKQLETRFKELGLSPTVSSEIIKSVISITNK